MSKGYVVLTFRFEREGKRWVALCDELGTSTFGRSLPEAERKLEEAVVLHLDTLEDVGERERFFKEHSITLRRTPPGDEITICTPVRNQSFVRTYIQPLRELAPA